MKPDLVSFQFTHKHTYEKKIRLKIKLEMVRGKIIKTDYYIKRFLKCATHKQTLLTGSN